MNIQMETVPRINAGVKVRREQFGLLLVSKRTPILALNEDSAIIWECIDGRNSVEEIAAKLQAETEEEKSKTAETVRCFVESCFELGLLEIGLDN